ncbi:topless-related protein 3-like [Impatiens glandulifera]|uniref:topless-related protein 3-like n=1 Tax=Impatiens glandulifera TaxID=253017 RepID=UPI001FB13B55|nr:topless-related protein 3-like [Impatiens glandulifera]
MSLTINHVCPPLAPAISLPSLPLAPAPLVALRDRAMPNYAPIRGTKFNLVPRILRVGQSYTSYNARVSVFMPRSGIVNVPMMEDVTEINHTLIMPQQITKPDQCLIFTLPDIGNGSTIKVGKLMYTNEQCGLLALTTTENHKYWKWSENRTMTNAILGLSQPSISTSGTLNYEAVVSSSTITRNIDCYLLCSNGMNTLMRPQPDSTFTVYHPHNKNIILSGIQESFVSGVNSLILQLSVDEEAPQIGEKSVEFHTDKIHICMSYDMHLAIFDILMMTRYFRDEHESVVMATNCPSICDWIE